MKSLRRNNQGQFAIVAALIIAILTLSLVSSISQVSLKRQELKTEPIQETSLNLISDFERCLTNALRIASQEYNKTGDQNAAIAAANNFINSWAESVREAYANIGLKLNILQTNINLLWMEDEESTSSIQARFSMSINAYGINGMVITTGRRVTLCITDAKQIGNEKFLIEFRILQTGELKSADLEPVINLDKENVYIRLVSSTRQEEKCEITAMSYLGSGQWSVNFTSAPNLNITKVKIIVKNPTDGILIGAAATLKQEPNSPDMSWSILYLTQTEKELSIVPFYLLNKTTSTHETPTTSRTQTLLFSSPQTPFGIELNDTVMLSLYVDAASPGSKNVEISFGYNGIILPAIPKPGYNVINENATFTLSNQNKTNIWPLKIYFDASQHKNVPEGSNFWLRIVVTFQKNGEGTIKFYMKDNNGKTDPSTIYLYGK